MSRPALPHGSSSLASSIPEHAEAEIPRYGDPPRERSNIQGASCIDVKPSTLSTVPMRAPMKGTLEHDELRLRIPESNSVHSGQSPLSPSSNKRRSWFFKRKSSTSMSPTSPTSDVTSLDRPGSSLSSNGRPPSAVSINERMPKFLRPVSSYGDFDKMNTNDQRKNKFRHSRLMRHAIPYPEENERPPQSKAAPSGFGCFFCVKDTTTDTSLQSEKAGLV